MAHQYPQTQPLPQRDGSPETVEGVEARATITKANEAPAPDDPRKPQKPSELTKPSKRFALSRTISEFLKDQCTDLAAGLTYYSVLALFPAVLALVSLLGLLGQGPDTMSAILRFGEEAGFGTLLKQVEQPLQELINAKQSAGVALGAGLIVALWSASNYVGAFGRALNRIYEVDEGRPLWKLRPTQLFVTLVLVLFIALISIGLVVSGPIARTIGNLFGLGDVAVTIWSIAKWPVMVVLVVALVALLYYATPNVRQPKFRWLSPGALLAIVAWGVASAGFGFYVANFSSYNKTYGSLAGVIIFLLWLWLTNNALLLGAELDAEVERGRQLQAGIEAEKTLQLPPRDDKVTRKRAAKLEKAVAKGRAIRESHGETDQVHQIDQVDQVDLRQGDKHIDSGRADRGSSAQ